MVLDDAPLRSLLTDRSRLSRRPTWPSLLSWMSSTKDMRSLSISLKRSPLTNLGKGNALMSAWLFKWDRTWTEPSHGALQCIFVVLSEFVLESCLSSGDQEV